MADNECRSDFMHRQYIDLPGSARAHINHVENPVSFGTGKTFPLRARHVDQGAFSGDRNVAFNRTTESCAGRPPIRGDLDKVMLAEVHGLETDDAGKGERQRAAREQFGSVSGCAVDLTGQRLLQAANGCYVVSRSHRRLRKRAGCERKRQRRAGLREKAPACRFHTELTPRPGWKYFLTLN